MVQGNCPGQTTHPQPSFPLLVTFDQLSGHQLLGDPNSATVSSITEHLCLLAPPCCPCPDSSIWLSYAPGSRHLLQGDLFGSQGFTFNNYIADSQFCSPALITFPRATLRILLLYLKFNRFTTDCSGFIPSRPLPRPPLRPIFSLSVRNSLFLKLFKPEVQKSSWIPCSPLSNPSEQVLPSLPPTMGSAHSHSHDLILAPGTLCWPMGSRLPTSPHRFLLSIQVFPLGLQDPRNLQCLHPCPALFFGPHLCDMSFTSRGPAAFPYCVPRAGAPLLG